MTTRLSVNINPECEASLQAYARAHDVTVTEAVRHAITFLNFQDIHAAQGNRLAAVDAAGKVVAIVGERS